MTAPTTEIAGMELVTLLPKESVYVYVMVVKITEAEAEALPVYEDREAEAPTDIQGIAGAANPVSSPKD